MALSNSLLHLVQQILIHPSANAATVFTACTLGLDWTLRTSAGGIVLGVSSFLGGMEAEGEILFGRAPITTLFWIIVEVFFAEEAALAAGRGMGLGDKWCDTR
jgi:hypothetical protein